SSSARARVCDDSGKPARTSVSPKRCAEENSRIARVRTSPSSWLTADRAAKKLAKATPGTFCSRTARKLPMVERELFPCHSRSGSLSGANRATVPNRSKRTARYFFTGSLIVLGLALWRIKRLAAGEPLVATVIEGDLLLPVLPAQFHHLVT